jgi:hypothetical protein
MDLRRWIPACAGMTEPGAPKTEGLRPTGLIHECLSISTYAHYSTIMTDIEAGVRIFLTPSLAFPSPRRKLYEPEAVEG